MVVMTILRRVIVRILRTTLMIMIMGDADGGQDDEDHDDGGGYDDMNVNTHWTICEHVLRGHGILPHKNLDRTSLHDR